MTRSLSRNTLYFIVLLTLVFGAFLPAAPGAQAAPVRSFAPQAVNTPPDTAVGSALPRMNNNDRESKAAHIDALGMARLLKAFWGWLPNSSPVQVESTADAGSRKVFLPFVTKNSAVSEAIITPGAGGQLLSPASSVKVEFLPGAVADAVRVRYQGASVGLGSTWQGLIKTPYAFDLTATRLNDSQPVSAFPPEVMTYTVPYSDSGSVLLTQYLVTPTVRLEVAYEEAYLGDVAEEDLGLYYWDRATSQWVGILTLVDEENNVARAGLDHFTRFALLADTPTMTTTAKVVIDPDHGGGDPGGTVTSPPAYVADEKVFNLEIAQLLRANLEACGVQVIMTREDDSSVSLGDRVSKINGEAPDASVTVAVNILNHYMSWWTGTGPEAWVKMAGQNQAYGQSILGQITDQTLLPSRGVKDAAGWGGGAGLYVPLNVNDAIAHAQAELAFMDNYYDRTLLDDNPEWFANALSNAIFAQVGITPDTCEGAYLKPSPLRFKYRRALGYPLWASPAMVMEPILSTTGGQVYRHRDLEVPNPGQAFVFERTYNSNDPYCGDLGCGWAHTFGEFLWLNENGEIDLRYDDGRTAIFKPAGDGTFESEPGVLDRLESDGEAYILVKPDNTRYRFEMLGQVAHLVSVTERNGNKFALDYGASGYLSTITDPAGRAYTFTYNGSGLLLSIKDAAGRSVGYAYDDQGNLVDVTDTRGGVTHFKYDGAHHVVEAIDPEGYSFIHDTYDEQGRVSTQVDASNGQAELTYSQGVSETVVTDNEGNATTYRYDERYRPVEIVDALGYVETFEYDDDDNLVRYVDKRGGVTERTFDDRGNMTSKTDPLGRTTAYEYDSRNNLVREIDPLNRATRYEYDEHNNLVRIIDPMHYVTEMAYNDAGQPIRITDTRGLILSFTYDANGQLASASNNLGHTTIYENDSLGRRTALTDPEGHTTRFSYDDLGHLVAVIDPRGNTTYYEYDDNGNVIRSTDRRGNTTRFEYNADDKLSATIDPLGGITRYTYDEMYHLVSVTDANDHTTRYEYDAVYNLVKITDPRGGETRMTYNEAGQLTAITDPNGHTLRYELDAAGQVTAIIDPLNQRLQKVYDDGGRLIKETDPRGAVTQYTYDDNDNVIEIVDALSFKTRFSYDPMGDVTRVDYPDNSSVRYVRDLMGRLTERYDALNNVARYEYDRVGNTTRAVDENGNETRFEYDPNDNLVAQIDALGRRVGSAYDEEDNLISTTNGRGYTTEFKYDELNRQVKVHNALDYETLMAYDPVGNLVQITDALDGQVSMIYDDNDNLWVRIDELGYYTTYTYDPADKLVKITDPGTGVTRFEYDAAYHLLSSIDAENNVTAYTYDPNGNPITLADANGHVTTFSYDLLNRLTSVKDARDGVTTYDYDPLGRRTRLVDPMGFGYSYEYDPVGRLLREVDPLGYAWSYTYDAAGNRLSTTDANGNKTAFEYDAVYNMARIIDAKTNPTTFAFDANNNLVRTINALNYQYENSYDALDRVTQVINPLSGVTTNAYDGLNRLVSQTDPKGGVTRFEYDAASRLLRQINALNYPTDFYYDPMDNLTHKVDANQHDTQYEYDLIGRLTRTTDPMGHVTEQSYDGVGNMLRQVDARGNTTEYEYDPTDNLSRIVDALGGETSFAYDLNGNLTSRTNPNGHTWSYEYNAVNSLAAGQLPLSQRAAYRYDGNRNTVQVTNAKGNSTDYEYDALNLLVTETDPLQHATRYEYDALKRLVQRIDALDNAAAYGYDGLDRLIQVVDALGGETQYEYDPIGNVTATIDANDHRTEFDVDLLGQVVGETNPVGSHWTYTYDPVGNLSTRMDANGALTRYEYDADDLLTRTLYPSSPTVSFDYDATHNRLQMADATGTTQAQYDALNRLTQIGHVDGLLAGQMLNYGYDPASNRTQIVYPNSNVVSYAYNANEWLQRTTDPKGGIATYEYDPVGLPVLIAYPNNTQAEMTYNADDQLMQVYNRKRGASTDVISIHDYTFDAVHNRTQVVDTFTSGQLVHVEKGYEYDALYRVTGVEETPDFQQGDYVLESYSYDPAGNRLSMITNRPEKNGPPNPPTRTIDYTYDAANRMLTAGNAQLSYDANGNRTQKLVPDESKVDYTYDEENRLTQAQAYRALGNGNWQEDYTFDAIYDGLGRRAEKGEVNQGVRKQVDYLMDGWAYDVLSEYPDPGRPVVTQYYRDPLQIISRLEIQGGGKGLQYWYHYDGRGNVSANTNHQGLSVHEYRYDAYGTILDVNGKPQDSDNWTDPHNHYMWSGKEFDEETELNYYGARYYDASTGVWLTQDSYRGQLNSPMSLHRYAYVANNPVNLIDPYGLWTVNLGFASFGNENGTWSGSVNVGGVSASGSYNTNTGEINAQASVNTRYVKGDAYYNRTKVDGGWKHDAGVTGAASIGDHTYGLNAHGSIAHGCNAQRGCFFDAAGRILVTKDDEALWDWGGEYSYSSNRSYKGAGYTSLAEVEDRFNAGMPKLVQYVNGVTYERALAKDQASAAEQKASKSSNESPKEWVMRELKEDWESLKAMPGALWNLGLGGDLKLITGIPNDIKWYVAILKGEISTTDAGTYYFGPKVKAELNRRKAQLIFTASLVDPIDWVMTGYSWKKGDFSFFDLLTFAPIVPGVLDNVAKSADDLAVVSKLEDIRPGQVHHFATNKSSKWTAQMEDIAKNYDLELDQDWNTALLPHEGRHPDTYHQWVLEQMQEIDDIAQGDPATFLKLYEERVKKPAIENPGMLYSDYWQGE